MKYNVYAIFDSKAETYTQPVMHQNDATARRMFHTVCRDKNTTYGQHPGDFTLFRLGTYDDADGMLQADDVFENLGNGAEYARISDYIDPDYREGPQ